MEPGTSSRRDSYAYLMDEIRKYRTALDAAALEMEEAVERFREEGGGGFTEGELRRGAEAARRALAWGHA
jgi:hypothetical protein